MTNKGLIVVNSYEVFGSVDHMCRRLKEEFAPHGISLDIKKASELALGIDEHSAVTPAKLPYDFAIYLDKDPYISILLERTGLPLFNSAAAIAKCDDKMQTYLALIGSDIAIPKTIAGPLRYSEKENTAFLDEVSKLGFPLVVKENYGSLGKKVYLARDMKELKTLEEKISYLPRLYQEFISSSAGEDLRVIVVGGKAVAAMKRRSINGDFRSNIALGGVGEKAHPSPLFLEMAERVALLLGLDYCGVDLLKGENGEPILCEVNSNAFIQGIEKVTGVNVAKAYASYICNKIYK
ncbi:MAG: RimK family alpha-L-glutamate ligase [Bacilli bacterium]|nr:RimK family alpha-L-glutamate ligase [Bacilli bacterium]